AVILPTFMEVLDTTIVSVSLPHIAGSLSASTSEATWVQTSYLISNAIILPASAWFSSFFGRKRFLMTCVAIFTFASFLCGIAPTLGVLIFARVLQGAGGGALQPLSQAILLESFPPAKRGQAMSVWGLGIVAAPVLGPLVGGWITDNYSWRWLFYINIPVGVLALWSIQLFISDPDYVRNSKPGQIDAIGFGLLALWLGTMQTVLDKGQDDDWFSATWICWFTFVSVASLIAFLICELRARHPIVNLRVFANRNFAIGTILATLFGIVSYSPLTLLPLFLQNVMGYTAIQSGFAQSPRGIGAMLGLSVAGLLTRRIEARKLIIAGILLCGAASLMMGNLNLEVSQSNFALANLLQGVGLALTFVPLATSAMGLLRNEQMGSAAGLFNLMRNLGGSIGISLVTTMIARGSQAHQATLVTHLTPYDPASQSMLQTMQTALAPQVGTVQAQFMAPGMLYRSLLQQSGVLAYVDDFRWLALLSFISIPVVPFLKRVSAKGAVSVH
ncbi:MAG TPA: DHA2 family efflux MFS transporter permease subunit, partial [Candidatus Cybelea sp.]|nr:DHA2 family efflux MFS transporter permease subunit [Candidatus Cybelea sp.]